MKADLHIHSTASDGQYTPSQLVCLAKERGLEVLALTDHDTLDGLDEAVCAGAEQGVRVLRGIELSAKEYPTFHILGYNVNPKAAALNALCREMKSGRDERSPRIIQFLKKRGIDISLSEVEDLAGGSIVGRPHFAQVLTKHGYTADNTEAFGRYLDTAEFHRWVERPKPPVRTCMEAIKAAGGKISLAHPYQIGVDDQTLEKLVRELTECGLDAIECYYPKYSSAQQAFYLRLAERYRLHITGGSDFHGEKVKPEVRLSRLTLDLEWLN